MPKNHIDFSRDQMNFLAVFEVVGTPISLDIVNAVAPLMPSSLLDLLRKSQGDILQKTKDDLHFLSPALPKATMSILSQINTKKRVSFILDQLNQQNLMDQVSAETHANLLLRSGRESGGYLEITLAEKFLEKNDHEKALQFYKIGLNGLSRQLETGKRIAQFIDSVLTYSDLTFSMGKEFISAYHFLESAAPMAEQIGDLRAKALIDLHIGRMFYIGNRRHEAVTLMKNAESIVNELGDEDILIRAAEFLALFYYMQGRFQEAMEYFETGFRSFETRHGSHVTNPSAPIFYGYCAAYLGQFHKAIGNLDSAWRSARQTKNNAYAATLRASLGMILLLTKKEKEAASHIKSAIKESEACENIFGWYFAQGYMAYLYYLEGRFEAASRLLKEVAEKGKQSNIVYQFSSPWLLEMVVDLKIQGHSILSEEELHQSILRMMGDPSIHIRGVLLRLIAQFIENMNVPRNQINIYLNFIGGDTHINQNSSTSLINVQKIFLEHSESYLKSTGDPVQLAKTRIEMARMALKNGNRKQAVSLAAQARKGLSGFWEDYFPDGIRALLHEHKAGQHSSAAPVIDNEQLLAAIAELAPSLSMDDFFHRMVATMNRLLQAEKGGLFWSIDQTLKSLSLRASRNLTVSDTQHPDFSHNMKAVRQCFKSGKPFILRSKNANRKLKGHGVFSLVCIPLRLKDKPCGVLYYDNSYIDDCFDFLNISILEKLAGHLNLYIDHVRKIEALIADATAVPLEVIVSGTPPQEQAILANSPKMAQVLTNIEQIACSDSTVLIQGETGVGKELMAERLHQLSHRQLKPFIIIDPTTLPENLVESELFGYEKGAFTGADKQKRGRIEFAHQGTLFIDEIGEMPKAIQAKLLRVLQEKTFVRIGGSRPIRSDFRLVAATNRNLASEVATGNFREDLFYRISIVPVEIPPLRERKEDILLLARHFFSRYKKKYNQADLSLSKENETALMAYHWPGNVRELINVIERAVILSTGGLLELRLGPASDPGDAHPFSDMPTLDDLQRRYIEYILKKTGGKISGKNGASQILNMKRSTLYSRMNKLGMGDRGKEKSGKRKG